MKKWGELALGVVTSIGGFLEVGSLATSSQAGAEFGYQLAWVLLLGTVGLACLMEMTGRLAAVSRRTYTDLLRERFGYRLFLLPLVAVFLVSLLVLASEIGGVSIALQMATGIAFRWWAIPVALLGWFLLWRGNFGVVEKGTALLGLVSISFAVGALRLHPEWPALGRAMLPSVPAHDEARYWYLAVSILGASISPYLYLFYSAGAIEDEWTIAHLGVNRVTASLGNLVTSVSVSRYGPLDTIVGGRFVQKVVRSVVRSVARHSGVTRFDIPWDRLDLGDPARPRVRRPARESPRDG